MFHDLFHRKSALILGGLYFAVASVVTELEVRGLMQDVENSPYLIQRRP